ncbi:MAG: hypothetical protein LBR61_05310 [Synergistaceae bacterium]|jgi:GGDEF domain-containing protein|nr:hypothetical protein [Synergistaceae bacterium]
MSKVSISEHNISIQWVFLPPFVAVFTFIIARWTQGNEPMEVNPSLWGLTLLLFVVFSILYGIFIHTEFYRGLLPVQVCSQGLLLVPLSLVLGSRLEWLGVTMTICGVVSLLVVYHRHIRSMLYEVTPELAALPFAFAITDDTGTMLFVSEALLQLEGRIREQAEGKKISYLLPQDQKNIELQGKNWEILYSPMEESRRCYLLVEQREAPAASVTVSTGGEDPAAFIDPDTSLYTRPYAVKNVGGDLYRARRYQRPLSATLMRMTFSYPEGVKEEPDKEDAIFNAWCHFIRANIRESDTPCLVGPRDVLVSMPETPLDMGREVAGKLASFETHVQEQIQGFSGSVSVRDGTVAFDPAEGSVDFDEFMDRLDEALSFPR